MIVVRKSKDRGFASHGWLKTHHTFSFADYYDQDFMGFGPVRVINQDRIAPASGFPTHGHRDMEIVTYVLEGVLEHRDSGAKSATIRPGEVQLMSAGKGILHSEANGSPDSMVHLLQMWVLPAQRGTQPRYVQRDFSNKMKNKGLQLAVSPDGKGDSLQIGQDASMYIGKLKAGEKFNHKMAQNQSAWLHVATGKVSMNDIVLEPGDGAAIQAETILNFEVSENADVVLWEFDSHWERN